MAEPEEIAARIAQLLAPPTLAGRRVLVTAGGTREAVDAVRFVGNRSSGRMGVALAEEARRRGAEVVLLAANLSVAPPAGVEVVATPTAEAMLDVASSTEFDVALLAAAVADYRPVEALAGKRPKRNEQWTLELEPTADIARLLGERKRVGQVLVTFGAELGAEGLERKRRMLDDKNADLVVFNDVSRADIGFDAAENEVVLVTREGDRPVPKGSKATVAAAILDEAERLLVRA
jgi:phosphopantothenoylcysteine decarboxylase/phosphopantothenate--cysteine ligase